MDYSDYLRASNGYGPSTRAWVSDDRAIGDMQLIVDSTLNWPAKFIATIGNMNPDGSVTEVTSFFGHLEGGTIIQIDEFAPGYVDSGNVEDQTVFIKPTSAWADLIVDLASEPGVPTGGTTGQVLTKVSNDDGDADWEDLPDEVGVNLVPKEVPSGTVNGTNTTFTTSQPYVAGSLIAFINGLAEGFFVTETDPSTGEFEFDVAPLTGDNIFVSYQFAQGSTSEADVLDGYHANATPTANTIPVLNSSGFLPFSQGIMGDTRYYTSNDTWTKPAGLKFIIVEAVGGGGGAGGCQAASSNQFSAGGGGGGGGYSRKKILAANLSNTESVTIGAGGAGGAAGVNAGSAGGTTSFGSHLEASGGDGGTSGGTSGTIPNIGGNDIFIGGIGSGGDLNLQGGSPSSWFCMSVNRVHGSVGGTSQYSSQTQAARRSSSGNSNGPNGLLYGGGGSGGCSLNSGSASSGGNGAPGIVIVYEYF